MDKKKFIEEALKKAHEEEKKEIKSMNDLESEEKEFNKEEKELTKMLSDIE